MKVITTHICEKCAEEVLQTVPVRAERLEGSGRNAECPWCGKKRWGDTYRVRVKAVLGEAESALLIQRSRK